MKELIKKMTAIEQQTAAEKGSYDLFGLFLREHGVGKWDVLVSADWIDTNRTAARSYLAKCIQDALPMKELLQISHIVLVETYNPALPELQEAAQVEHGLVELKDFEFAGQDIERAYIITSAKRQAAA